MPAKLTIPPFTEPDDFITTRDEMLQALEARDCAPLTSAEHEQLVELLRRATGGLSLRDKYIRSYREQGKFELLPQTYLNCLHALASYHISNMGQIESQRMSYGNAQPFVYDPMKPAIAK